jgi:hypothetical protein
MVSQGNRAVAGCDRRWLRSLILFVLAAITLPPAALAQQPLNSLRQIPKTTTQCSSMSWDVVADIAAALISDDKHPRAYQDFLNGFPVDKILQQECKQGQFDDAYELAVKMERQFNPAGVPPEAKWVGVPATSSPSQGESPR